jgi:hypothetical protein
VEIVNLIVAMLALPMSIGAVWYARRVANIERERRDDERADALRNRVRFELVHESNSSCLLRNLGTAAAYDVHVELGDLGGLQGEQTDFEQFPDGEVARIHIAQTYGSTTERVVVTWHCLPDKSDPQQRTTFPIPAS